MARSPIGRIRLQLPLIAAFWLCFSCAQVAEYETLRLRYPELAPELITAFGEPLWLVTVREADGKVSASPKSCVLSIVFQPGCTASVLAYPTWPEHSIGPGIHRPAGAIYPFGAQDGRLILDWKGGVSAYFHAELARVDGPPSRSPDFFDWPGFLELLDSDSISIAVKGDPWLVDWTEVALKTRVSGFDRRRLVPRPSILHRFALPAEGPWFPSSPFGYMLQGATGSIIELPTSDEVDSLINPQGIFRHRNGIGAWFLLPSCTVSRLQL